MNLFSPSFHSAVVNCEAYAIPTQELTLDGLQPIAN
jgi:hypothetical protein